MMLLQVTEKAERYLSRPYSVQSDLDDDENMPLGAIMLLDKIKAYCRPRMEHSRLHAVVYREARCPNRNLADRLFDHFREAHRFDH